MPTEIKFDLSYIPPSAFDIYHVGLALLTFVLLILLVFLMLAIIFNLLRKNKHAAKSVEKPVIEKSQPVPKAEEKTSPKPEPVILKQASPDAALQLMGLLQQEARFIDFIEEDVNAYSDAEIGAAARVVHKGCQKVIQTHFKLEPVRQEAENSRITLSKGFDASAIRLTGNIVGSAPYTGNLVHRGWRATKVKLPKLAEEHDVNIVAAAELEL